MANLESILNIVIHPGTNPEDNYEAELRRGGLTFEFFKNVNELRDKLLSLKNTYTGEKKIMLWIHPELGMKNFMIDTSHASRDAKTYSKALEHKNIHPPYLSRVEKSDFSKNLVSTLDLHDYLKENFDKLLTLKELIKEYSEEETHIQANNNKCHVLIISALQTEFQSLYNVGFFDENGKVDEFECYTSIVKTKDGTEIIVKGYPINNTGMIDAAIYTSRLIEKLNPQYVIMNGVCGGNPEKKRKENEDNGIWFCDIVIPSRVFTYQKGKATDKGFEKDPEGIEIDTINKKIMGLIIDKCKIINGSTPLQQVIYNSNEDLYVAKGIKKIQVLSDSMACGTAVISKDNFFTEEVKPDDRNAIALEMESYAVIRACQKAKNPKPTGIIIKSIMDFTVKKEDGYKKLAEYTSAKMTELVIKEVLKYD